MSWLKVRVLKYVTLKAWITRPLEKLLTVAQFPLVYKTNYIKLRNISQNANFRAIFESNSKVVEY